MSLERRSRTPDCIVRPDGTTVPWEKASDQDIKIWEEEAGYFSDRRDERKRGADTGHGKGSRNKSRPGRATR